MSNKPIMSFDFASLYPTTMRVFDDNYWREWEKMKKQRLRRKKLEEIQKLNETTL